MHNFRQTRRVIEPYEFLGLFQRCIPSALRSAGEMQNVMHLFSSLETSQDTRKQQSFLDFIEN